MIDYVFIDSNNGHFEEYFNFKSNANKQNIEDTITQMTQKDSSYLRFGMSIYNLEKELISKGFDVEIFDNPRNRQHIDRIPIHGTSGNY